jgi:hypothetical protein
MKTKKVLRISFVVILFILTFILGSTLTFHYRSDIEKRLKKYLPKNCGAGLCHTKKSAEGIESCYCKGKSGRSPLKCCLKM